MTDHGCAHGCARVTTGRGVRSGQSQWRRETQTESHREVATNVVLRTGYCTRTRTSGERSLSGLADSCQLSQPNILDTLIIRLYENPIRYARTHTLELSAPLLDLTISRAQSQRNVSTACLEGAPSKCRRAALIGTTAQAHQDAPTLSLYRHSHEHSTRHRLQYLGWLSTWPYPGYV